MRWCQTAVVQAGGIRKHSSLICLYLNHKIIIVLTLFSVNDCRGELSDGETAAVRETAVQDFKTLSVKPLDTFDKKLCLWQQNRAFSAETRSLLTRDKWH